MIAKIVIAVVAIGGLFYLSTLFVPEGSTALEQEQVEQTETAQPEIPTNVPMYPDSVLSASTEVESEGERNITLTLTTQDSVADVNTWYRGALKQNGWAVTSDKVVGGYVLLKGERENLTVFTQVANGDGGTVITERIRIK